MAEAVADAEPPLLPRLTRRRREIISKVHDYNAVANRVAAAVRDSDRLADILADLGVDVYPAAGGTRFVGPCPVHGGTGRNFRVGTDGQTVPIYWACHSHHCERQWKSSLVGLVRGILSAQKMKEVSFLDAVGHLKKYVEGLPEELPRRAAPVRKVVRFAYRRETVRAQLKIPAPYLLARGFGAEVLDRFDVGYSPKRGHTVIPIYDDTGEVCVAVLEKNEVYRKESRKYNVVPEGFSTGQYLYNHHAALSTDAERLYVVESPLDAIRLADAGAVGVALFGTEMTAKQAEKLVALGEGRTLAVAFDNDPGGRDGGAAAFDKLRQRTKTIRAIVPETYKGLSRMPTDEVKRWLTSCFWF